jgi:hypothetical protein
VFDPTLDELGDKLIESVVPTSGTLLRVHTYVRESLLGSVAVIEKVLEAL